MIIKHNFAKDYSEMVDGDVQMMNGTVKSVKTTTKYGIQIIKHTIYLLGYTHNILDNCNFAEFS